MKSRGDPYLADKVASSVTELMVLAYQEEDEAHWDQAMDDIRREVRKRYPDFSRSDFTFALGRAVGRIEGHAAATAAADKLRQRSTSRSRRNAKTGKRLKK